jgi:chromosome segregation ATPase
VGSIRTRPGGRVIPNDFQRLSRVVGQLVDEFQKLRRENAMLRRDLGEREVKVRALEEKILELNQLRTDVAKRIDDLVAHVELLDAKLESAER